MQKSYDINNYLLCFFNITNLKKFALRDIVIIFYYSTEILSILENAGKIGVPTPEKLKEVLEQCKNKKEKK